MPRRMPKAGDSSVASTSVALAAAAKDAQRKDSGTASSTTDSADAKAAAPVNINADKSAGTGNLARPTIPAVDEAVTSPPKPKVKAAPRPRSAANVDAAAAASAPPKAAPPPKASPRSIDGNDSKATEPK